MFSSWMIVTAFVVLGLPFFRVEQVDEAVAVFFMNVGAGSAHRQQFQGEGKIGCLRAE